MSIIINDNLDVNAPKLIDARGKRPDGTPYLSKSDVLTLLPQSKRSIGLPVFIVDKWYYFKTGITLESDIQLWSTEIPNSIVQTVTGNIVNNTDPSNPIVNFTAGDYDLSQFTNNGSNPYVQNSDLNNKVDKIPGKGLSTEDYTTSEKSKLSGIESGAQVNKIERVYVNGIEQTIVNKGVNLDITNIDITKILDFDPLREDGYNIGEVVAYLDGIYRSEFDNNTTSPPDSTWTLLADVGGGTGGIYNGNSPSTITVQNIPSGTNILGMTYDELIGNIYAPFVSPTFSTFNINGQSTSVEVGTTISGNKVFNHSFTNVGNITPNSLSILDVTNNVTLKSGEPIGATTTADVGTIQKTTATAHSWRGRVTSTQSQTVNSSLFTINWRWKVYWGTSSDETLASSSDVLDLVGDDLKASLAGTYSFAAGDYKYFVSPNAMGNIASIKDQLTGFDIPLADSTDNPAYNQTQTNGLTYAILSVTNAQSVTTNHRVYRSKNILGGSVNAIITI